MSNELDKFVLRYEVETKESIKRLEELEKRISRTNKKAEETGKGFKDFVSDATGELDKLGSGVDKVGAAVRGMASSFTVATVAIGALAIGVKSVMDLREQYNKQRLSGQDIGMSGLRLEEYQRKFVKESGGKVTRDQTEQNLRALSQIATNVHKDVTGLGEDSIKMRALGFDTSSIRRHAITTGDFMERLGKRFAAASPEQVQAMAKTIGITPDFAASMASLSKKGTLDKVTELTDQDISKRQEAEQNLQKFNGAMAELNEKFKEAENELAQELLPAMTKLVEFLGDVAKAVPGATKKAVGKVEDINTALTTPVWKQDWFKNPNRMIFNDFVSGMFTMGNESINAGYRGKTPTNGLIESFMKGTPDERTKRIDGIFAMLGFKNAAKANGGGSPSQADVRKADAEAAEKAASQTTKVVSEATRTQTQNNVKLASSLDKSQEESKQVYDNMQQAINLFSGAVHTFANAIDEKQAWAAWAGEIGRASLGPARNAAMGIPGLAPTRFDALFQEAGKAYGVSPDLLKRIAKVESQFNPTITSPQGAKGLMQIMPANFKSLGITDPNDPRQNIMGGAKLFSQYLAAAKGDVTTALMMYHGGFDRNGWGPLTRSYPGKVLGTEGGLYRPTRRGVEGESRESINLRSVQANIANRLGVPLSQVQQGGIGRGDIAWSLSQMTAGVNNAMWANAIESSKANIPASDRARAITGVQEQARGLMSIQKYGSLIESQAPEGDRSITVGERAVQININAPSNDPNTLGEVARTGVVSGIQDVINQYSDGLKY